MRLPSQVSGICFCATALCAAYLGAYSASISAAVYRCTDESGKLVFSDIPCDPEQATRVDESELPPLNASESTNHATHVKPGASSRRVYQLKYPDGRVRNVTKAEYEAQMRKNEELTLKEKVDNAVNNLPQQQREANASRCFQARQILASGTEYLSEKIKLENFLRKNCGGIQ